MTTSYTNRPPPVTSIVASAFDKAAYTTYEKVKTERDALKETENVYKKRCEHLEKETNDLLKSYQNIYAENKVLRSKVQHGPDSQRIRRFREEIKRLEEKVALLNTNNSLLRDEVNALQKQCGQISENKKRTDEAFKMERGLHLDKTSNLEKENKILEEKVEKLEKQQIEYEHRIKNFEEESEGLIGRYKELKIDNLKMESKFKKQKDQIEEEVTDTKSLNKDMAKELIQVKTKLSKTQSELNSTKLDCSAAEKQIDFLSKELDVYKHQESQLKKKAKHTATEKFRIQDELKSVENMLQEARNFGFEAVFQERQNLKRREEKHLKRIETLEMQIEELSNENTMLEKEANEYRGKMEAIAMENQDLLYAEGALKRRIDVLENANIELDRAGKFVFERSKKGLVVKIENDNVKNIEKEKKSLLGKLKNLESENGRLERRIWESDRGAGIEFEDDMTLYTVQSRRNSRRPIRAEMPSLLTSQRNNSYRRKLRTSRSLPPFDN